MADNSSNSVASVAIVILVIVALVAGYYFFMRGGVKTTSEPAKIEVSVPTPSGDKP